MSKLSKKLERLRRIVGVVSLVVGLALAAVSAYQTASLAAVEIWWNGARAEDASVFALLLAGGVILGSAMLVAGGVETLRGAPWARRALGAAVIVTVLGWGAIPALHESLGPILDADAHDPVRFRHSLHFSGDLDGDLKGARFILTIAGRERTCGRERDEFSMFQVSGAVGGREVTLWITIRPYHGPDVYRSRHEYGAGIVDPGQAELVVEQDGYQDWYAMSGTITVNSDERSGSIDAVNGPLRNGSIAPKGQTRISGTWQCLPPKDPATRQAGAR